MKIPDEVTKVIDGRMGAIYVPSKLLGEEWKYRVDWAGRVYSFWKETAVEAFCVVPDLDKINYMGNQSLWIWTILWWLRNDEAGFRERANGGWRMEELKAWAIMQEMR